MAQINSVAFVTYNTVGKDNPNGWMEHEGRKALLIQNPTLAKWGARIGPGDAGYVEGDDDAVDAQRARTVEDLLPLMRRAAHEADHVVVYLGAGTAMPRIIEAVSCQPPGKLTFVTCDCNLPAKLLTMASHGLDGVHLVDCECGGHSTMERLRKSFLETGQIV